jgi:hypothetical protein
MGRRELKARCCLMGREIIPHPLLFPLSFLISLRDQQYKRLWEISLYQERRDRVRERFASLLILPSIFSIFLREPCVPFKLKPGKYNSFLFIHSFDSFIHILQYFYVHPSLQFPYLRSLSLSLSNEFSV